MAASALLAAQGCLTEFPTREGSPDSGALADLNTKSDAVPDALLPPGCEIVNTTRDCVGQAVDAGSGRDGGVPADAAVAQRPDAGSGRDGGVPADAAVAQRPDANAGSTDGGVMILLDGNVAPIPDGAVPPDCVGEMMIVCRDGGVDANGLLPDANVPEVGVPDVAVATPDVAVALPDVGVPDAAVALPDIGVPDMEPVPATEYCENLPDGDNPNCDEGICKDLRDNDMNEGRDSADPDCETLVVASANITFPGQGRFAVAYSELPAMPPADRGVGANTNIAVEALGSQRRAFVWAQTSDMNIEPTGGIVKVWDSVQMGHPNWVPAGTEPTAILKPGDANLNLAGAVRWVNIEIVSAGELTPDELRDLGIE